MLRIGLISDTHGLLRPQAVRFLRGCDHIVHAGDIGPGILGELAQLAPVSAVRGNTDAGPWAAALPETQTLRLGGVAIFVLHDLNELAAHHQSAGVKVVICGHSHQPKVLRSPSGVLIVNPGSAGPRRFRLPVTAAELTIRGEDSFSARVVELLQVDGPDGG